MSENVKVANPLGTESIKVLANRFAIPSIIAMLVGSLYNVVDQFFIGQSIGELGNAATNIVYPTVPACVAIALLFGIGGASSFNLAMGMGKTEDAKYYIGSAATLMFVLGVFVAAVCEIFCDPLLSFFGCPENVFPYAAVYMRICALGFPFQIFSAGASHLVRADGSPTYSMKMNLTGAIVNIFLDALFIFVFGWGMAGAAAATVTGQVIASLMGAVYFRRYKTVELDLKAFVPSRNHALRAMGLGASNCINQMAMMALAIVLNKSLSYYGAQSVYGDSVPLAVSGIALKCMQIMMAVIIGFSQGLQPIASFNYGARNYDRVKEAVWLTLKRAAAASIIGWAVFELFPLQILELFGSGSDTYFKFGVMYIRVYYIFMLTYFGQPIISNFFSAIGKPKLGIFLSLTRQVIFLLPLLLVLPLFMGLNGVIIATPITDMIAFILCFTLLFRELKRPEYQGE